MTRKEPPTGIILVAPTLVARGKHLIISWCLGTINWWPVGEGPFILMVIGRRTLLHYRKIVVVLFPGTDRCLQIPENIENKIILEKDRASSKGMGF